jgi:hypothetical protein
MASQPHLYLSSIEQPFVSEKKLVRFVLYIMFIIFLHICYIKINKWTYILWFYSKGSPLTITSRGNLLYFHKRLKANFKDGVTFWNLVHLLLPLFQNKEIMFIWFSMQQLIILLDKHMIVVVFFKNQFCCIIGVVTIHNTI